MTVPYTFATQNGPIPLSELDSNFSALQNTNNINYTAPFTNAVQETLTNKLAQTVSIKDFGAVYDGVTDDSAAWQAALNWAVSNGGGTLLSPQGISVVNTALVVSAVPAQGITIFGYNSLVKYNGTGIFLHATLTAQSSTTQIPSFGVYGLNILSTNASGATAAIQYTNMSEGRLIDVLVGNSGSGKFANSFIFENTNSLYSENIRMERCGSSSATNSAIYFVNNGGTISFARFTCRDLFVAGGVYVIDVNSGAVYDALFDNITGNFSGNAILNIESSGSMEGSTIRGIHTETGGATTPYGFALLAAPTTTKPPAIYDWGNYAEGSSFAGVYINSSNAAVTPTNNFPIRSGSPINSSSSLTINGINLFNGSYVGDQLVALSGTSSTTLSIPNPAQAKGAFIVSVTYNGNDGPTAIWAVAAPDYGNAGGRTVINVLASVAGYTSGETLSLTWPNSSNYMALSKSGSGYNGNYTVTIMGA